MSYRRGRVFVYGVPQGHEPTEVVPAAEGVVAVQVRCPCCTFEAPVIMDTETNASQESVLVWITDVGLEA